MKADALEQVADKMTTPALQSVTHAVSPTRRPATTRRQW
ncbi:hypothetical protein BURPS668_3239 [Burkholderia pseudomallei 668]|nr:hypothetical protein BURPS668_3239 [Burkholderia pseudomallei 668]